MNVQNEFVLSAIQDVQETNRFLDAKAGVLIAFETLLLAFAISCLHEDLGSALIKKLFNHGPSWYGIMLLGYLTLFTFALLWLIFRTIKIISPSRKPEIELGTHEPKALFYLNELKHGKLAKSFAEYKKDLSEMNEESISDEYIFEFLKLSFLRKVKSESIALSLKQLFGMILGIVLLGLLFVLGEILY